MFTSVVASVTDGVSATGVTVSTNVSVAVSGVPPTVFVTVTVIVVVPNASNAGVMVSVRVDPLPVIVRFAGAFGTSVLLLDVAVIVPNAVAASPTLKSTGSGVSSVVALSVMSSIVGSASSAPMSTVGVVFASAASRIAIEAGAALVGDRRRVQERRVHDECVVAGVERRAAGEQRVRERRAAVIGQRAETGIRHADLVAVGAVGQAAGAARADQVEGACRVDRAADVVGRGRPRPGVIARDDRVAQRGGQWS